MGKHKAILALLVIAALGIPACGGKIKAGGMSSASQKSGPNGKLAGVWTTGCKKSQVEAGYSLVTNYEFGGDGAAGSLSMDTETYRSENCSQDKIITRVRMIGHYSANRGRLLTNFSNSRSYLTYYDGSLVASANQHAECGARDWGIGVEHEGCVDLTHADTYARYVIRGSTLEISAGNNLLVFTFVR